MGQHLTSSQIAALGTAQINSQGNPYPIPLREIGLGQAPYGEFGNTPAPIDFAKLPMQALAYLLHNANFIKSEIEVLPFFDQNADLSEFAENFENGKYIYRHLETNFKEQPPVERYNYIGVKKEQIEFWGSAFESEESARESIRGPFTPIDTTQLPAWGTEAFLFFEESMNYDTYNSYSEIESYIYENTEALYLSWQQRLENWKTSELLKPQPNQNLISDINRQEQYRANERLKDLQLIDVHIIADAENLNIDDKIAYANILLRLANNIACKINFDEKLESYSFAKQSLLLEHEDIFRKLMHSIRWKNFYIDRFDNSTSSKLSKILNARNLSFLKCYLGSRIKPIESFSSEQIPVFTSASIPALAEAEMGLSIAIPGFPSPFPEDIGSVNVIKIDYTITYIDDYQLTGDGEYDLDNPIYATDEMSSKCYLATAPNILSLKKENCYQRFHPSGATNWWTRFAIYEPNNDIFTFISGIRIKDFETKEKEYVGLNFSDLFDLLTGENKDENELANFAPDILEEWMASTDYVKYVPAVGNPGDPNYQEHKIDASLLRQTWQPFADKIKAEHELWGTANGAPAPESPVAPAVVPVGFLRLYNKYEQLISSYPLYALDETVAGVDIKYYFSDEYINSKYDWINDIPIENFNPDTGGGGGELAGGRGPGRKLPGSPSGLSLPLAGRAGHSEEWFQPSRS